MTVHKEWLKVSLDPGTAEYFFGVILSGADVLIFPANASVASPTMRVR